MNLPDRSAILDRERRWTRPAGIAAILGVFLLAAGLALRISVLSDADGAAEALQMIVDEDLGGQLLTAAALSGLAYLLFGATLTFLFIAARDRSDRVLRGMIGLSLVGVICLAAGGVVSSQSLSDTADQFVAAEASVDPTAQSSEDSEDEADDRAEDLIPEGSGYGIGTILGLTGTLGFAIGFLYTSLSAMRTGLLSRFWGSLGMACAVVFIFAQGAPEMLVFQELWFLATGFLLLGAWVGGRPPAWEAGVAIPSAKPGEQAAQASGDTIEGEGREVTDRDLGEGEGEGEESSNGPAEPPRKRKRRR